MARRARAPLASPLVPETPEQLYARAAGALRMPRVEEWETFPFGGDLRPRPLRPPLEREPPRIGEGGADCPRCKRADGEYLWTDEHWRLWAPDEPTGLPLVVLLESRDHYAEPGDLPDELAAELGLLLARIERAVRAIGEIGRVHVCRWGDGGEHLHWWFMARPARLPQLLGIFAAVWDDVLPPVPEDVRRTDLDALARTLSE
jgi:diadenosine tetraphosphate (Ap4A) HIT family hydrolase